MMLVGAEALTSIAPSVPSFTIAPLARSSEGAVVDRRGVRQRLPGRPRGEEAGGLRLRGGDGHGHRRRVRWNTTPADHRDTDPVGADRREAGAVATVGHPARRDRLEFRRDRGGGRAWLVECGRDHDVASIAATVIRAAHRRWVIAKRPGLRSESSRALRTSDIGHRASDVRIEGQLTRRQMTSSMISAIADVAHSARMKRRARSPWR